MIDTKEMKEEKTNILDDITNKYFELKFLELTNNDEYKRIVKEINSLFDGKRKIIKVYRDKEVLPLTKKEVEIIIKCFRYLDRRNDLIKKHLVFSGYKIAYIMAKESNMLKDEFIA